MSDKINIEISDHALCLDCGDCCKAFGLSAGNLKGTEILEKMRASGDVRLVKWYDEHIEVISCEDAVGVISQEKLDSAEYQGGTIHRCKLLDEDNRCGDYEGRPDICRSFPGTIREKDVIELGKPVHHYVSCRLGDATVLDEIEIRAATDGSIKVASNG